MGLKKSPSRALRQHHECQVMRRMLVKRGHIEMTTGAFVVKGEDWVERLCGVQLFSGDDRVNGKCQACARGWAHPNNYPVGNERPAFEINA